MTNRERVLAYLSSIAPAEATNADICSGSGVEPHQQVFQITQRLVAEGFVWGRQYGKEWRFSLSASHPDIEQQPLRNTTNPGVASGSNISPSGGDDGPLEVQPRKRKSGVPTGHAGEYLVMGELLRREFDAQLADRNTKGYDVLVGDPTGSTLRKVQVKTVRSQPWYVSCKDFEGTLLEQVTIYVLLGTPDATKPVRFFIATNRELAGHVHKPASFDNHGFMPIKAVIPHEGRWDKLRE